MTIGGIGASGALFAALAALPLLSGCAWPTYSQSTLKAIKTESQLLMTANPIKPAERWTSVPQSQWPPVIASLHPYSVTVHQWGVHISIKPYFDGGWGYMIPRDKRDLPMPEACYSSLEKASSGMAPVDPVFAGCSIARELRKAAREIETADVPERFKEVGEA
ncbi:MAG TPA: hypothetical protein VF631_02090 [Allosphingosinicella sp.]|jgi:hypothetical protein|uniref:hypothetical protein n=1 Tax=Allosphingosinicella sp. TaxID=2823234 RepID=UPI002F26F148